MGRPQLDNRARMGKLESEPAAEGEFRGLVRSGTRRLEDAAREELSLESRFDLAHNAVHAMALAALRFHGYRSDSRYLVFHISSARSDCRRSNGGCSTRPPQTQPRRV